MAVTRRGRIVTMAPRALRPLLAVAPLVLLILLGMGVDTSLETANAANRGVEPTLLWVNFYGLTTTFNGAPVPIGARITAYDPDGVECGEFEVQTPGQFGVMPVYGDDLTTPEDEGALPGDTIVFRVNGLLARVLGPDQPRWTSNGDLWQVELAAGQFSQPATPPAATPTTGAPGSNTPTATVAPPTSTHFPQITPSPAASATRVVSPPAIAASATPSPNPPTAVASASPPPLSPTRSSLSPTSTPPTGTPASRVSPPSTVAPPAGTPAASSSPTVPPRETPPASRPSPDTLAILGLASSTPAAGAQPSQQEPPPATASAGTPASSAASSPSPLSTGDSSAGVGGGGLLIGVAVAIVLLAIVVSRRVS